MVRQKKSYQIMLIFAYRIFPNKRPFLIDAPLKPL
jgi:hypothetical protein